MPADKVKWKDKSAVVVFHMTPERKNQWKELAKAAGAENLQNQFEEFLRSKAKMSGLSDLKKSFLMLKEQQVQLGKAIGMERLKVLVTVFKKYGGDVQALSNYQPVCGKMLKEWAGRQEEPSHAISEVIQFEAYLEVNKKRVEAERELLGYVDGAGAAAAAAPAATPAPAPVPATGI